MPSDRRSLADLGALRDRLEAERVEQERRAAERRERDAAAVRDADLFRKAIGTVEPLRTAARATHRPPPPEPVARQRAKDEAAALAESLAHVDELDPVLVGDDEASWHRAGVGRDVVAKLRRGHWVVQDELDLHGHRVDEARTALAEFLHDAVRRHLRCLRVVHGKGHGSVGKVPVLKGKVRGWLARKDEVLAFSEAREIDGGAGALIVLLRPA